MFALPYLVIACAVLLFLRSEIPGPPGYVVHVAAFFVCALACHLRLAEARPPATHLTEFYVWLSVGGALGGLFNVLIAPNLFHTVLEYPIALVAAAALSKATPRDKMGSDFALPAALALILFSAVSVSLGRFGTDRLVLAVILGLGAVATYSFRNRALRFALGVAAIILAGSPLTRADGKQVLAARSFYGVYRVVDDSADGVREFFSGTTLHGAERLNDTVHAPLAYYHRDGPLGSLFAARSWREGPWRVGVIGLGAGATASYANAGESWTFFELDPLVAQVAESPRLFQYLTFAKTRPHVVVGDARVSLERDSARVFDMMIIDAFSSDAIPTHLLTREAVSLYRSRLAPDGLIAWHISNRYVDLRPVLDALARDAGLVALIDADESVPHNSYGRFPSIWVVTTASDRTANALRSDPRWLPLHTKRPQLWTDEFSNVFRLMHWGL
jgi:spermidine synthase